MLTPLPWRVGPLFYGESWIRPWHGNLPPEQNDRHRWKHYLPATSSVGGINLLIPVHRTHRLHTTHWDRQMGYVFELLSKIPLIPCTTASYRYDIKLYEVIRVKCVRIVSSRTPWFWTIRSRLWLLHGASIQTKRAMTLTVHNCGHHGGLGACLWRNAYKEFSA